MDNIHKELDSKIAEALRKYPEEVRKEALWDLLDALKKILGPDNRYYKLFTRRD